MTKIKYLIRRYDSPKKVEIEKETEQTIWIKGERGCHRKGNTYEKYVDNIQDGKDWLIDLADKEIERAERSLEYRKEEKESLLKKLDAWPKE